MRASRSTHPPIPLIAAILLVLAAGVVLVGLAVCPARAAAAPDAAQIDGFLALHGSPMTGAGATFVAEGAAHGVDPAFLVAITGAESSFGQFLYAQDGDQCTYNAFNWFYGPTWPQSDFSSWDEAIARVAEGLAGDLYYGSGLYSVQAIAPRYCPDGTDAWIANVTSFMMQLGGDPNDTRFAGVVPYEPPSTDPGLLALRGSVKLSGRPFAVGRKVTARFTITNEGDQPVALEGVRLAARGPGAARADLGSDQAVTLAPGQALAVAAVWPLDTAGRWRGWIEVVQNGEASLVGRKTAFSFRVTLPRDVVLRRWMRADAALSPGAAMR